MSIAWNIRLNGCENVRSVSEWSGWSGCQLLSDPCRVECAKPVAGGLGALASARARRHLAGRILGSCRDVLGHREEAPLGERLRQPGCVPRFAREARCAVEALRDETEGIPGVSRDRTTGDGAPGGGQLGARRIEHRVERAERRSLQLAHEADAIDRQTGLEGRRTAGAVFGKASDAAVMCERRVTGGVQRGRAQTRTQMSDVDVPPSTLATHPSAGESSVSSK